MNRIFSIIFAAMAFLSPLAIGGNWPFTRTYLLSGVAALLIAVCWKTMAGTFKHTQRLKTPLVFWILFAGIAYTWFQSSALSSSLQQTLGSPDLAGIPSGLSTAPAVETEVSLRPISVYAAATRQKLVDLGYGVALFLASFLILRDRKQIMPVVGTLTAVGVVIGFLGIVQKLSGDDRILGQYKMLWGGAPFATFVNSNNAAGFLTLCFSAAVFFVALQFLQWVTPESSPELALADKSWGDEKDDRKSLASRGIKILAQLKPIHLYFITAIAVIVAATFASGSRGGMVSLFASAMTAIILISRSSIKLAFLAAVVTIVGGAAVVHNADQTSDVSDQIQSLTELSDAAAPRILHWQDALPFGWDNALLGCGNGTYRYVSPFFQSYYFTKTYAHAECVYIETFVEMGLPGLILLLCVMAYCFSSALVLLMRTSRFDRALGIAGLTCLIGQTVAASLDFGIYQPANTTGMAMMMGAVVSRRCAHEPVAGSVSSGAWSLQNGRSARLLMATLALLMCCWAVYESYGVEARRSVQRSVKLFNVYGPTGTRGTRLVPLARVERLLGQSITIRPDDALSHILAGEVSIAKYRQQEVNQLSAAIREEINIMDQIEAPTEAQVAQKERLKELGPLEIWNASQLESLHRQLRLAQRSNNNPVVEQIRNAPSVIEYLGDARTSFLTAEHFCDRIAKTPYRLALLQTLTADENEADSFEREDQYLKQSLQRGIPRAQQLFQSGLLQLNSGNQDAAVSNWRKCLELPHQAVHERAIVEFCLQELSMRRFFEEVLPQNPPYLLRIAKRYLFDPNLELPRRFLIQHTKRTIMRASDLDDLQRFLLLAQSSALIDDYPETTIQYQNALPLAGANVPWRFDYAFALYQTKQFDESLRQLKMCELDPSVRKNRVKALLARIRRER